MGTHASGGSIDNGVYWACITSYDYDAPISEAGDTGQPGIGGPNKFDVSAFCFELTALCVGVLPLLSLKHVGKAKASGHGEYR